MKRILLLLLLLVLMAACGANQSAAPLPTSTIIPTFAYQSPSPFALIATAAATETLNAPGDLAVTAGHDRYVALECNTCHGENAEGSDKGPALAGTTLSEDDFITYLRSGGKIGTAHQYASNRLSDRGAHNLYRYVESLTS